MHLLQLYIMTSVNFGWLIRSIHRWSASMMVMLMVLHIFRVYLTGGFKKLCLGNRCHWFFFGVTGYHWDQVGFWACKIVTGVPAAVPIVGPPLVLILRGGESVGQSTLTRFYSAHTFVLPLAAAVLMLTLLNDP
jgi:cytochrome b6